MKISTAIALTSVVLLGKNSFSPANSAEMNEQNSIDYRSHCKDIRQPLPELQAVDIELKQEPVSEERFEDAARLRDTIRQHSQRGGAAGPGNAL